MKYNDMLRRARTRTALSAFLLVMSIRVSFDAVDIEDVSHRILAFAGVGVLAYAAVFLAVSASVYRTCAAMHLANELKMMKDTGLK